MAKAVHSQNPLKPGIVAALKALAKARKVTNVKEVAEGFYTGRCMWGSGEPGTYAVYAVRNEHGEVTHYIEAKAIATPGHPVCYTTNI